MKNHRCARAGLTAFLAIALSAACIPNALALAQNDAGGPSAPAVANASASAGSTATFEKSEAVYANLAADGAPEAVYVVNRFDVEAAGTIVDEGDYEAVRNLTNETALEREAGRTVFEAEEGAFLYQGDASQAVLPWNVSIAYELDGRSVRADELAGASGDLAIHVATSRNDAVDPAFYDSFMLQITFTLPDGSCSDVAAEGATIARAGQDATVAFTVLPGHDADSRLTARVQDFSMAGAQIVALPYSSVVDVPDADGLASGMDDLSSAVSELTEGTESLAAGVDGLTGGARDLSSGAVAFGDGLSALDGSSSELVGASARIEGALSRIADGLSNADFSQLDQVGQLPTVLRNLADALDLLQGVVTNVQAGYDTARTALDGAVKAIPDDTVSSNDINALKALTAPGSSEADTVDKLAAAYTAARAVKTAYGDGAAFTQAHSLLALLSADKTTNGSLAQHAEALRVVASQIESSVDPDQLAQLSGLADGLVQLSGEYARFHGGLSQYASGLSALSGNYARVESGTEALADGTGELAQGAARLSGGMGELNAATIELPETMRRQIEEMTADFDFPAFDPVSFASPANENVTDVQFVMATAAIEKPKAQEVEEPQAEPTIWDRFLALFS